MEAGFLTLCDEGRSQSNGNMGFPGSGAANKDQVVGILCELTSTELLYLSLLYSGKLIVECGEVLMMGKARNPHLIMNGPHTSFCNFCLNQLFECCYQVRWCPRS